MIGSIQDRIGFKISPEIKSTLTVKDVMIRRKRSEGLWINERSWKGGISDPNRNKIADSKWKQLTAASVWFVDQNGKEITVGYLQNESASWCTLDPTRSLTSICRLCQIDETVDSNICKPALLPQICFYLRSTLGTIANMVPDFAKIGIGRLSYVFINVQDLINTFSITHVQWAIKYEPLVQHTDLFDLGLSRSKLEYVEISRYAFPTNNLRDGRCVFLNSPPKEEPGQEFSNSSLRLPLPHLAQKVEWCAFTVANRALWNSVGRMKNTLWPEASKTERSPPVLHE